MIYIYFLEKSWFHFHTPISAGSIMWQMGPSRMETRNLINIQHPPSPSTTLMN